MTGLRIVAMAVALALAAVGPAQGRIQSQMFCWDPDAEFPIACDEDDEGDDDDDPERTHASARSSTADTVAPLRQRALHRHSN